MRMDSPKISVIVPVYKAEAYLRKCLDSIAGQTYRNLEIILVDDGSPDNCGAICDEYAARDGRFVVIHQENGGVSTARNAGLAAATGDWIGWVDSDDWIEADMFEYLLTNALEYDADIAVCGRYEVYGKKKTLRSFQKTECLDRLSGLKLLLENDLMQNYLWDKLWRRELFQSIFFPVGRTFEDIAVMHRLFERADRVLCLPEAKYYYLQRENSIVASSSIKNRLNYFYASKGRYEEMKEHWPELEETLLSQCAAAAIGVWCGYLKNPRQMRKEVLPQLREISDFCTPYAKRAGDFVGVGLAGRLVLALVRYTNWWAFAISGLVGWAYKLKHGRDL